MSIKKMIRNALSVAVLLCAVAVPAAVSTGPSVGAATPKESVCAGVNSIGGGDACAKNSKEGGKLGAFIGQIIQILLFVIGAAAVVMIVIGGIRYVTSGGDANSVTGAKNTVLYAVIGLIVAVMAYAIVNFVLNGLK